MHKFLNGISVYLRGLQWLCRHPQYFFVLILPNLVGHVALIALGIVSFRWVLSQWSTLPVSGENIWAWLVAWALFIVMLPALIVATWIASVLITQIFASPVYDYVSIKVEQSMGIESPTLGWSQTVFVIKEEIKKAIIMILAVGVLAVVPILNLLSLPVGAFLVGWDYYDYPLSRRGWSLARRWSFVSSDAYSVTGFGLWMVVPFLSVITIPFAIVGGTILCLEKWRQES